MVRRGRERSGPLNAAVGRVWRKVLQGQELAALVWAPGDGDVSAGAVCLDGESVDDAFGSGCFVEVTPDVESVA